MSSLDTPSFNFARYTAHRRSPWQHGLLCLWATSNHGGFHSLRFEHQAIVDSLGPQPMPDSEDYPDSAVVLYRAPSAGECVNELG